jgi:hypothetical protein
MTPADRAGRAADEAEAQAARAAEHFVGTEGFGGLLGQLAENTAAIGRLGNDAMDLVLRNLRVAGRRDVLRLSRQLSRTQDQLERVLQEVEALRTEPSAAPPPAAPALPAPRARAGAAKPANGKPVAP